MARRRRDPWREWDESIAADEARRRPPAFNARRALRSAGVESRELGEGFARTGAGVADDLGGRLRVDSLGAVLVSAAAALMGLILLDLALSARGSRGVSLIIDAAGSGVRKLVDPYEPLIQPAAAAAASSSTSPDPGTSPDGPRREAPGDPSAPPPSLTSFVSSIGGVFAPLPTSAPTSSGYNIPDGPEGVPTGTGSDIHGGLDWFAPAGTVLVAPFGGRVVEAKRSGDSSGQVYGGTVKVQDPRSGLVFVARHVNPGVQVGDTIAGGSPIARVAAWAGGSTHAHLELWRTLTGGYTASNLLDPFRYLVPTKGV